MLRFQYLKNNLLRFGSLLLAPLLRDVLVDDVRDDVPQPLLRPGPVPAGFLVAALAETLYKNLLHAVNLMG